MTKSKKTLASVVVTLALGAGLAVFPSVAASASSWPCDNNAASVGSYNDRVRGTGSWICKSTSQTYTFGAEVHVFHNYDFFPDVEVFYGAWVLYWSTASQAKSTIRCDQGITAQYFAEASMPGFYTSPWKRSSTKIITSCAGTGA